MISILFLLLADVATTKRDSQILAENMPAIELWTDNRLREVYQPYFDCYWMQVKDKPDSKLKDLDEASRMFNAAYNACAKHRQSADEGADAYLSGLPKYASPSVRADILPRYRRQMGFFSIGRHYADIGKTKLFNDYVEMTGRASREKLNAPNQ